MNSNQPEFLKTILNNKKHLVEIIAAAIIIGLGIEFIASSIFDLFEFKYKNLFFLGCGILLTFIGFLFYLKKFFGQKKFSKEIDGFFILDRKKKEVIDIDNYDYSNKLFDNLESAFNEDKALKKTWKNIDFKNIFEGKQDFLKIITEASEYYLLEKLSTHLSGYFNNTSFDKNLLVEYERNDIPDVLLNNRFLELFSKPMEFRESFITENENDSELLIYKYVRDNESDGVIISNTSRNGAKFSHFDLKLPVKSKLIRNNNHSISLITDRFTMTINTIVGGMNTYIPSEYIENYLEINYSSDIPAYVVSFEFEINFKTSSLLRTNSWNYYQWIDSFIKEVEQDISEEYYFNKKIEWDKIYPILKILKNEKSTTNND